ncbi:MAG: hypothetical protein GX682_00010 [Clostridiaceae bacterium]|nr:hypothetical protein [Clostridiaceae bacterium]
MMQPFPFLGFQKYRRPYQHYSYNGHLHNSNLDFENYKQKPCFPSVPQKKEEENSTFSSSNESCDDFFEIFGIKLSVDDLLILALLFFLYKENVDDNYLFVALILLLLS